MSSENDGILQFPRLVDSEVSTCIETNNDEFINTKERIAKISFLIENEERNKVENTTVLCDFPILMNINYKLKSACSQIEESIKNLSK
jgi:hypothetical protein